MPSKTPDVQTEAFGVAVARLREARGWKQTTLARKLTEAGLSATQPIVARIEKGRRVTRLDEVTTIAAVLGVPVSVLTRSNSDADPFAGDGAEPSGDEIEAMEAELMLRLEARREALHKAAVAYGVSQGAMESFGYAVQCRKASTIAREGEREGVALGARGYV